MLARVGVVSGGGGGGRWWADRREGGEGGAGGGGGEGGGGGSCTLTPHPSSPDIIYTHPDAQQSGSSRREQPFEPCSENRPVLRSLVPRMFSSPGLLEDLCCGSTGLMGLENTSV